ncbi:MAG TPA: glycosyltransferase, partial [bacterium]|nr:glycosyltransferase [bacterium]
MKKLAHIITKLELGGAQLNTIYTVNYFAEKNYEVYLITGTGGIVDKSIISSKVKIIEIEELAREINILKDLIAFFRIFWLCRKYKFDIVHTHSSKAGILGRLAAYLAFVPKIIHTVHGWGFTPLQSEIAYKTFVLLERLCAKITDKLVVVADDNCNKGLK